MMRPEFDAVLGVFSAEITGCRDIVGIADNLAPNAPALDLSDLYRQSLAGAVSALDTCVHSVVRTGILLQLQGFGPSLSAQLPVSADLFRRWYGGDSSALNEVELALRLAHGRWTMQFAQDIADAVKLVSARPLWVSVAGGDSNLAGHLKTSLNVVVDRRNKIAHESDLDPSTGTKWPIDSTLTVAALDLLNERGAAIVSHVATDFP
jgi:hypothetical protein